MSSLDITLSCAQSLFIEGTNHKVINFGGNNNETSDGAIDKELNISYIYISFKN